MFEEDVNTDGTQSKHLTRTWIIFFERIFKSNKEVDTTTTSSVGQTKTYTFGLGVGSNIAVGSSATPKIRVNDKTQLSGWSITANTAPAGSSIIVDIKRNGVSIFKAGGANEIVLPATLVLATGTVFLVSPMIFLPGDLLLPDVIQVGSSTPGFRIQVELFSKVIA
jgi:hypothetical protein